MESYDLADAEKPDAIDRILKVLDKAFEYDSRVQLPQDFDKFFTHLHRRPGQTLLQYVTDYDECYRKLEDHKISLPGAVQGWHLMRRAGLTKEQRQLIITQAPTLERNKVQEAMYLILGQDHRHVAGHAGQGDRFHRRGKAYYGEDAADDGSAYDPVESYEYDETYWPEADYDDTVYYHNDLDEQEDWEAGDEFDQEAGYYGDEPPPDPSAEAQAYDEAYAAYLDARKRFSDLKLARGFLPVVALADAQANLTPGLSPTSSTSSPGRGKGKGPKGSKGKGKGKGKNVVRYPPRNSKEADPRGRAYTTLATTCLRCGQQGHTTHNCPQPRSTTSSPTKKRAAPTESTALDGDGEAGMVTFPRPVWSRALGLCDAGPWCQCIPHGLWTLQPLRQHAGRTWLPKGAPQVPQVRPQVLLWR